MLGAKKYCRVAIFLLLSMAAAPAFPAGQLILTVVDRQTRQPLPCRIHLKNPAGRPQRAGHAPFWHDHFVCPGEITLRLRPGAYTFEIECGLEYAVRRGHFQMDAFSDDVKTVDMVRFADMAGEGWWSGDFHVKRREADMKLLMAADDLHVAPLLTWSNDGYRPTGVKPLGKLPDEVLHHFDGDRFCHVMAGADSRAGGTLLYFNLDKPLDFADVDSEYPPVGVLADRVRQETDVWVDASRPYWWDLPVLAAADQIDSVQLLHSQIGRERTDCDETGGKPRDPLRYPPPKGNARWSQQIYFHLLEAGLRIPPSAGSGSGIAPNPVGANRMYVYVDGTFSYEKWWQALRAGQVVVTNGPLLRPSVQGHPPGHVFHAAKGQTLELQIGLTLSTRDPEEEPIRYLELIKNGEVAHSIRFEDYATSGKLPLLQFQESGWFLVRAMADARKTYRCGLTGPYYVEFDNQRRISRSSAQFFLDWVYERARQIKLSDPDQQAEVIAYHRRARDFWQDLVDRANAD
ncbi:MAG: CehA/McbA family metallohydrolase [Planctomycetes bacterium]|nr:CehA/McbA family metallohydrolase [Planctomycetota bacterium]